MSAWTDAELERVGDAQELELHFGPHRWEPAAARDHVGRARWRSDLRPFCGRSGSPLVSTCDREAVWVASVPVASNAPVTFGAAAEDVHPAIDAAYHAKYDQYGASIVGHVVGPAAQAVTIRLDPIGDPRWRR